MSSSLTLFLIPMNLFNLKWTIFILNSCIFTFTATYLDILMGIPRFFRWLSERYPLINQGIERTNLGPIIGF